VGLFDFNSENSKGLHQNIQPTKNIYTDNKNFDLFDNINVNVQNSQ
jgi:hypothetical protein